MLKKIAKNSSYLVFSATLVKASFFLWSAFVARYLGKDLFGQFNYLTSFTIIFTSLPDLGFGLILTRQLSRDIKNHSTQWYQYKTLNHILALLSIPFILILFIIYSNDSSLAVPMLFAACLFALSSMRAPYMVLLQASQRFKQLSICELVNVIGPIVFSFIALLIHPSVTSLFAGQIIGMSLSLAIIFFWSRRILSQSRTKFNFQRIIALLKVSLPIGLAAFFGMVTAKIDQLFIARMLSTSQLGLFAVANSLITGLVGIFSNTFTQTTLPALSQESTKPAVAKLTILALFGALTLSLLVYFASPFVILVGFGQDYTQSIRLAQIMGFSLIFLFFNRLFEQVLLVKHKEWFYLIANLLGAGATIGLNIYLISTNGLTGAAFAKVISQLFLSVILSSIVLVLIKNKAQISKQ